MLGYTELEIDTKPVEEHFESFLGAAQAEPLLAAAKREIGGPFQYFDAIYSIRRGDGPEAWSVLDLDAKIRFVPAPDTPFSADIGRALAHRRILREAEHQGLGERAGVRRGFRPLRFGTRTLPDRGRRAAAGAMVSSPPSRRRGLPCAIHSAAFWVSCRKPHRESHSG